MKNFEKKITFEDVTDFPPSSLDFSELAKLNSTYMLGWTWSERITTKF